MYHTNKACLWLDKPCFTTSLFCSFGCDLCYWLSDNLGSSNCLDSCFAGTTGFGNFLQFLTDDFGGLITGEVELGSSGASTLDEFDGADLW